MEPNGTPPTSGNGHAPFTRREIEVLSLLSLGYEFKQTGLILGLSSRTVEKHIHKARRKLKAVNTPHAVRLAMERGILTQTVTA